MTTCKKQQETPRFCAGFVRSVATGVVFLLTSLCAEADTGWTDITESLCGGELISKDVTSITDHGTDLPDEHLTQGTTYEYKLQAIGPGFFTESNTATGTPTKVVVLVRGYGPDNINYWASMKQDLEDDGFEVWDPTDEWIVGQYSIAANAKNLKEFIDLRISALEQDGNPVPERISIVAHSMGGLIVREFMARGSSVPVDYIVMLSPAHCGSWLANHLLWLGVPVGSLGVGAPFWSSTHDLKVENALWFNRSRHVLPAGTLGTRYYTIAGTSHFPYLLGQTDIIIGNWIYSEHPDPPNIQPYELENDGVVTRLSSYGQVSRAAAHATLPNLNEVQVMQNFGVLGFASKESVALDHDAIIKSDSLYTSRVRPLLFGEAAGGAEALAVALGEGDIATTQVDVSNAWRLVSLASGTILNGAETNHTRIIDTGYQGRFDLTWTTGQVAFVLHEPDGTLIDPTSTNTRTDVAYAEAEGIACYTIQSPMVGVWTSKVTAVAVGTNGTDYVGSSYVDNNLSFLISRGSAFHSTNSVVTIQGTLDDNGTPVTNATVSGSVRKPDQTATDVTLFDDGAHGDGAADDGVYGVLFDGSAQVGIYAVNVNALGKKQNGEAFQRVGVGQNTFTVFSPQATFTDTYDDYGIDDPPTNGLIDRFVVEVGISATETGVFTIAGTLTDTGGVDIASASTQMTVMATGLHTALLDFASGPIYDSRAVGGFDLVNLVLLGTGENYAPLDSRSNAYATAGYDWDWFEPSDTDGDGLSNLDEMNTFNTDPEQPDSDADGLSDYSEVAYDGDNTAYTPGADTDPGKPDTDDDVLPDGWEVAHGFNPLIADATGDADGDGLNNTNEYLWSTDPQVRDTDGEGLEDGPEVNTYGTHPNLADTDEDGLTDYEEVWHDGDGGYNPYDPTNNPTGTDTDATNPDSDGDGIPDGWEADNGLLPLQDDAANDGDGDGLSNLQEYQYRLNPGNPDTDSDGAPDGWELQYLLHANNVEDGSLDYDGDGHVNWQEYVADTIPTNINSFLGVTGLQVSNGNVVVHWQGGVLATQLIERCRSLLPTSEQWTVIFTNVPPTATTTNITDAISTNRCLFYRIKAQR